ncbi:hypothetical protein D3C81_1602590 [compost metagenome]
MTAGAGGGLAGYGSEGHHEVEQCVIFGQRVEVLRLQEFECGRSQTRVLRDPGSQERQWFAPDDLLNERRRYIQALVAKARLGA